MWSRLFFLTVILICVVPAFAWSQDGPGEGTRFAGARIRAEHPRIYLNESRVEWLQAKTAGKSIEEVKALAGTSTEGLALVYAITGDEASGREAITRALKLSGNRGVATMAIVYDWCYTLLSDAEKKAMRDAAIPVCKTQISTGRSWRSFHNSLYSTAVPVSFAAIALSGDDPWANEALDFLYPQWEDVLRTFDNVFPDGAWGEGFDYNRHVSYEALRFFAALKTATGRDFMAESPHLKNTGYYILYCSKPDGLVFPEKDCDFPFIGEWEREALLISAYEYRNGYYQHYLAHCPAEEFQPAGRNKWRDLLWGDVSIAEKAPSLLPASRLFRGDGLVVARSGWGWDGATERVNDTWMAFHCGDYYGDHAHFDNNSFEIYHKGPLAIDSGRYDDDWGMEQDSEEIRKSQFFNYYQRTIAHNTVLVYDPDETFEMGVVNDGGQLALLRVNGVRNVPEDYDQGDFPSEGGNGLCDWATNPGRWDTGDILAYEATGDFTYVCADATKSYSPAKMSSFVRQMVFLQPDVFVVFDRVVSKKAEFKKTWLLHTVDEPVIAEDGSRLETTSGEGRLVCVPLLPEKRTLTRIGGPGNEFLVGGIQYACGLQASSGRFAELHYGETPGAWRVEESPAQPSTEDFFLNVMSVSDAGSDAAVNAAIVGQDASGVTVQVTTGNGLTALIAFSKSGVPGGTLRIERSGRVVRDGALPDGVMLEDGRP